MSCFKLLTILPLLYKWLLCDMATKNEDYYWSPQEEGRKRVVALYAQALVRLIECDWDSPLVGKHLIVVKMKRIRPHWYSIPHYEPVCETYRGVKHWFGDFHLLENGQVWYREMSRRSTYWNGADNRPRYTLIEDLAALDDQNLSDLTEFFVELIDELDEPS